MFVPVLALLLATPEAGLEIGQLQQSEAIRFVGLTALDAGIDPRVQRRITEGLYRRLGLRSHDVSNLDAWTAKLRQSEDLYRRGETTQAIETLRQLQVILASNKTVWKESVDLLAEGLLLQGRALLHAGQSEEAKAAFSWYFSLRPHEPPDPARYRPQVISFYENNVMIPLAQNQVELELISVPAGLSVWLNGKRLGATPITIPALIPGKHFLRLEGGMATHQEMIEIHPSKPRQQHRALLEGQNPRFEKILATWRQQLGLAPLASIITEPTDTMSSLWMAGLASGTDGLLLHLVHFDAAANLVDLQSLPLNGDLSNLNRVLENTTQFTQRTPVPLEPGMETLVFGRAPARSRPPWMLMGLTATAVAAVVVGVGLLASSSESSGIYVDPRGLQ